MVNPVRYIIVIRSRILGNSVDCELQKNSQFAIIRISGSEVNPAWLNWSTSNYKNAHLYCMYEIICTPHACCAALPCCYIVFGQLDKLISRLISKKLSSLEPRTVKESLDSCHLWLVVHIYTVLLVIVSRTIGVFSSRKSQVTKSSWQINNAIYISWTTCFHRCPHNTYL